jgi:BMFP domain-containing protein YqiC
MAEFTPNPALDKLTALARKVGETLAASPMGDLEKNARQHFISQLAEQGLVTREAFDAERARLRHTQTLVAELEARIASLEKSAAHEKARQP